MPMPKDRFDSPLSEPGRVGAHRGPRRRGSGWIAFGWALLATIVLVASGLFAVSRVMDIDLGIPWLEAPTADPGSTFVPPPPVVTDPAQIDPARGITIIVINGTPVSGLQNTIGDELAAAGWPILSRANAGDRDILDTVVYYSNPADADVARGLVQALGVGEIQEVPEGTYPGAKLTIVLGMDHPLVPAPEPPAEEGPADEAPVEEAPAE